jgi:hypothetical protein
MLNVVRAWEACTAEERRRGAEWYHVAAHQAACIALRTGGPGLCWEQPRVAGVIAALSPGLAWKENLEAAYKLLRGDVYLERISGYGPNKRKALAIYDGRPPEEVLSGPKVTAFYRLIRDGGNPEDVCVDGHMLNLALGRGKLRLDSSYASKREADLVREAFRAAGHYLGVWPCRIQAAVWVAWRASQGFRQGRLEFC